MVASGAEQDPQPAFQGRRIKMTTLSLEMADHLANASAQVFSSPAANNQHSRTGKWSWRWTMRSHYGTRHRPRPIHSPQCDERARKAVATLAPSMRTSSPDSRHRASTAGSGARRRAKRSQTRDSLSTFSAIEVRRRAG